MYGRLAEFLMVGIFPCGPFESAEYFVEQPHGMIVGNSFFKAGGYKDDLISGPWRRLPVASIDRFLRHLPWSVISERFLRGPICGSIAQYTQVL